MRLSAAIVIFVFLPTLVAQSPAPVPARAKPAAESKPATPTPPDRKAFTDARGQKDPAAKLAALEKFLRDFPSSEMTAMARREIVGEAMKRNPKDAVRRTKAMSRRLDPVDAAALNRFLAAELVKEKKRLPDAEKAARQALKQLEYAPFAAAARRQAESTKEPAPAEEAIRARYANEQAQIKETLGQVLLARGRTDQARQSFEEALGTNPSLSPAALALAGLSEKAGNLEKALEYHAQAMLARPSPESRKRFSEAWNKVKGGEAGQKEWLDERYRKLFASPLHPVKYTPGAKRSGRVVLGELYTGAGCPPCLAADLAFDSM
ncbi:MAG TPA: tetratricopeptide repeat protein, partial [Bryobacteraceae bacterium]|nr:tetratricopeptide repeat protein [Bryobacteraceae bacterium]